MGEARADREPIDRRKGKVMTPRGTSNAFCTGASHFMFSLENISCVFAYTVVGCNYGVGERRAPAKTK